MLVDGLRYASDVLSEEDERALLDEVASWPRDAFHELHGRWGPRVRAFASSAAAAPDASASATAPAPSTTTVLHELPGALRALAERVVALGLLPRAPFQVSVNVYDEAAYAQLLPHRDSTGDAVAIVSLESSVLLDMHGAPNGGPDAPFLLHLFVPVLPEPDFCIMLEPRSVLSMQRTAFRAFCHGIRPGESFAMGDEQSRPPVANASACHARPGQTIKRARRVSVALWSVQT